MGYIDTFKGTSSYLWCSYKFIFNTNYFNRYLPKIISYMLLAESST